jgi:hypothetical protein
MQEAAAFSGREPVRVLGRCEGRLSWSLFSNFASVMRFWVLAPDGNRYWPDVVVAA